MNNEEQKNEKIKIISAISLMVEDYFEDIVLIKNSISLEILDNLSLLSDFEHEKELTKCLCSSEISAKSLLEISRIIEKSANDFVKNNLAILSKLIRSIDDIYDKVNPIRMPIQIIKEAHIPNQDTMTKDDLLSEILAYSMR